ncbi:hypothetical protein LY78DRAFT_662662 [Colletotrichum sublineola]|nr:hypothetical protein LY78DRAFT_662662 [Colletotrichum sublineola]
MASSAHATSRRILHIPRQVLLAFSLLPPTFSKKKRTKVQTLLFPLLVSLPHHPRSVQKLVSEPLSLPFSLSPSLSLIHILSRPRRMLTEPAEPTRNAPEPGEDGVHV